MFRNRVYWGVSLEITDKGNKKEQDIKSLSDYLSFNKFTWLKKWETPQYIRKKASLTVEAAVILPLVAGFLVFFLFYFRIMQIQLSVQEALEESGRRLAALSMEENREDSEGELPYLALAKGTILGRLGNDTNVERYVTGGVLGISLLGSEWENDDIILKARYVVKLPIAFFGKKDYWICQRTKIRKWTGWHALDAEKDAERNVYVTKYGEAYHMRKSCPYLELSIQKVMVTAVYGLRNLNGERYECCEYCGNDTYGGGTGRDEAVYVTQYGECYHFKMDCSGLKRTIYRKKLSEVEDMRACVKCWK